MSCPRLKPACLYVLHDSHPYYTPTFSCVAGKHMQDIQTCKSVGSLPGAGYGRVTPKWCPYRPVTA